MKKLILFIIVAFVAVGLDYYYGSPTNCQLAVVPVGAIIGAAGSLLGGLFSGLFSADAQASANRANLQATRETNAQNYKIWQEQLGFNRDYIAQQQAYNSPSAQRSRFEQAGINPYAMLGQTSNGNIDLQTAPQAPQMQRPEFQPVNYMSGISDAVQLGADTYSALSQAQKITSETRALDIDNQFRATKNILELRDKVRDIMAKRVKTKLDYQNIRKAKNEIKEQEINLRYADDTARAHSETARENARLAKEKADEAHWQAVYQQSIAEYYPKIARGTLNELAASAASARASASASYAQAGYSNALTETENRTRTAKVFEQNLKNALLRGQIKLQDFNLSQAELEELRKQEIVYKRGNSWFFRNYDGFVNWFTNPIKGMFKGK